MKMEYFVIIHQYLSEIIDEVDEYMQSGWEPIGGIIENHEGLYMQAMIKKGESK